MKRTHLGVLAGLFPEGLGVVVFDLLLDWGVLFLPALPGVLWLLAMVERKSLLTPLCLDVLLQAWQVAIWEKKKITHHLNCISLRHNEIFEVTLPWKKTTNSPQQMPLNYKHFSFYSQRYLRFWVTPAAQWAGLTLHCNEIEASQSKDFTHQPHLLWSHRWATVYNSVQEKYVPETWQLWISLSLAKLNTTSFRVFTDMKIAVKGLDGAVAVQFCLYSVQMLVSFVNLIVLIFFIFQLKKLDILVKSAHARLI